MLSSDQALVAILDEIAPAEAELCDLRCSHLRVLAQDIVAANDVPSFENSSMVAFLRPAISRMRGLKGESSHLRPLARLE